jgi:hypothetical protein
MNIKRICTSHSFSVESSGNSQKNALSVKHDQHKKGKNDTCIVIFSMSACQVFFDVHQTLVQKFRIARHRMDIV